MTNTLPAGMDLKSFAVSQGQAVRTNLLILCDLGILTNGTKASLTLQMVSSTSRVTTNTAAVGATEPDSDPLDNVSAAALYVATQEERTLAIAIDTNLNSAILSWPVSAVRFLLEARGNLDPTNRWAIWSSKPVVADGRNYVTNGIVEAGQFFQLRTP